MSSRSSSDDSLDLPKRRKKSGRRKLDEVERLAEMERQRRQKEVEQKVTIFYHIFFIFYLQYLPIIVHSIPQTIEDEAARRIEFLVKKRVEEELEKRKDEIEQEVNRRVEAAKAQMEREMMLELEKRREAARLEEQKREVNILKCVLYSIFSPSF